MADPSSGQSKASSVLRWNADSRALWPMVYDELRRLANRYMEDERTGHTLEPTALVHEAYLRLLGGSPDWNGRGQFFSMAARAMRHILVEHARGRQALKRGGGRHRVSGNDAFVDVSPDCIALIALDEALEKLTTFDPRSAKVVELRYFGGLTFEETARVMQIAPVTAKRLWKSSRAWLHREIEKGA